jgi:cobalamin biosynthesis Mg chelatase CobN
MKKSTKVKFQKLGKGFLKYAKSASKNIDRVNDDILGRTPSVPKTVSKPKVKRAPKVKKPQTVSKPRQQGQVIVNVYTGGSQVSPVTSKSKTSKTKKQSKKRKKKKKSTQKVSDDFDVLYGYEI